MNVVILVAGIGCLLVGLLAIAFGIPVKEFSFGNTLILTGAVAACTGLVMLALWAVVRELHAIARRLGPGVPLERAGTAAATRTSPRNQAPEDERDTETEALPSATSPAPWQEEVAVRDRSRSDAPAVAEPVEPPAAKPRRNLLFSSSSRRERERAQARAADPVAADSRPEPTASTAAEPVEIPPVTFDDAWPKLERSRAGDASLPQRRGRTPSTFSEATPNAAGADRVPPPVRSVDQPPVTVLKSGVVDGMAYSLYSDGSIEAQMPEGMMRFASIEELRAHLDQRP
jgi:hypothetical protein